MSAEVGEPSPCSRVTSNSGASSNSRVNSSTRDNGNIRGTNNRKDARPGGNSSSRRDAKVVGTPQLQTQVPDGMSQQGY
jgi:hypothetical protein